MPMVSFYTPDVLGGIEREQLLEMGKFSLILTKSRCLTHAYTACQRRSFKVFR